MTFKERERAKQNRWLWQCRERDMDMDRQTNGPRKLRESETVEITNWSAGGTATKVAANM